MIKYTAGKIKQAIGAITTSGMKRKEVMAMANKILGIKKSTTKTDNRRIMDKDAKNFFGAVKKAHLEKAHLDGHAVSGMTDKTFARTAVGLVEKKDESPSALEEINKRLEEKEQIKKDAGLKESAASARQHTVKEHNKPQIQMARDEVKLEELENPHAGAEVHAVNKTAAGTMGLTSGIHVPHPIVPPPAAKVAPPATEALTTPSDAPAPAAPAPTPTAATSVSAQHADPPPVDVPPPAADMFGP